MESNFDVATTASDEILAISEALTGLSEIIATKTSERLELSEVARDGLANIFAMLAEKLTDAHAAGLAEKKGGRHE